MPENTLVSQSPTDGRFYPLVYCKECPNGLGYVYHKDGSVVSFKSGRAAVRYLLATFGGPVVCMLHHSF